MAEGRPFEVIKKFRASSLVIEVVGEFDLSVAGRLRSAIEESQDPAIVVDLSRCDFIDSTGIAVVVRSHIPLEQEGRRLVACSPAEQVTRVLEITGLTHSEFLVDRIDDVLDGARALHR